MAAVKSITPTEDSTRYTIMTGGAFPAEKSSIPTNTARHYRPVTPVPKTAAVFGNWPPDHINRKTEPLANLGPRLGTLMKNLLR
jgi:hypothetical protein